MFESLEIMIKSTASVGLFFRNKVSKFLSDILAMNNNNIIMVIIRDVCSK